MPRSYSDKFTVSVMQGPKHVTFDFTSRVLDFIVLSTADEGQQDPGMFLLYICSNISVVSV